MKTIKILAGIFASAMLFASCGNSKPAIDGIEYPSKSLTDSVSYLVGVTFGYFIKSNGFGEINEAKMKEGIKEFIAA